MTDATTNQKKLFTKVEKQLLSTLNANQIINKYPDFIKRVIESGKAQSQAHLLKLLGINPNNNRARLAIKEFAESNDLEIPVYDSKNNLLVQQSRLTKEEVLERCVKNSKHYGSRLREWFIKFEIIEYKCVGEFCQLQTMQWGPHTVTLELDHINGDNTDNRLENLRFLCPICHGFTPTFRGRNSKSYRNIALKDCKECSQPTKLHLYCYICLQDETILKKAKAETVIPNAEILIEEVEKYSLKHVADKYFIDSQTLKKVIKNPDRYSVYPKKPTGSKKYPSKEELENYIYSGVNLKQIAKNLEIIPSKLYKHAEKVGIKLDPPKDEINICICGKNKLKNATYCSECFSSNREMKADYPPVDELLKMLDTESFESVARKLGVSSNAIRKHLHNRGIDLTARRKPNGSAYDKCECGNQKQSSSVLCSACATSKAQKLTKEDLTHVVESIKRNGISKTAGLYNTNRSVVYRFLERNNVDYKSLTKHI